MRRWTWSGIIVLIVTMLVCVKLGIEQTALFIFLAAILAIIPFFISYEQKKPKARDLMPIVVLSTLAIVGRMLFAALPNFKPVTAIVIISGLAFGPESGFMTGALTAFVSNIFFGQGPWTAWQILGWGIIGFLAGVLAERKLLEKNWQILLYGFLSSFFYGIFMDTWTVLGFVQPLALSSALTTYALGIPFNLSHGISTVLFLLPVYKPWLKQLKRIKIKFDLK